MESNKSTNGLHKKNESKPKEIKPSDRLDQLIERLEKAKQVLQKVRSNIDKGKDEEE